jgi:DNA processing protein
MSAPRDRPHDSTVCGACSRRGWLLATLAGPLDYCCRNRERLLATLALGDEELISALGGHRRGELARGYADLDAERARGGHGAQRLPPICRHQPAFPARLRFACGPRTLWVTPDSTRLCELARGPVVALLGSGRGSDYGIEVARALGRGLAVAGVAVAMLARDGICAAAMTGALEANGSVLCALPGGVDVAVPTVPAATHRRLAVRGCTFAEAPCGTPVRPWAQAAGERLVVGLAQLTILVEAENARRELAPARLATALGRPLAAVPGRVTSVLSSGTNALLAEGAKLVRDPRDAVELLGLAAPTPAPRAEAGGGLERELRLVLEEVSGGRDTPDLLVRDDRQLTAVLCALSELELRELVVRGDGGRYLPSMPATAGRVTARERDPMNADEDADERIITRRLTRPRL